MADDSRSELARFERHLAERSSDRLNIPDEPLKEGEILIAKAADHLKHIWQVSSISPGRSVLQIEMDSSPEIQETIVQLPRTLGDGSHIVGIFHAVKPQIERKRYVWPWSKKVEPNYDRLINASIYVYGTNYASRELLARDLEKWRESRRYALDSKEGRSYKYDYERIADQFWKISWGEVNSISNEPTKFEYGDRKSSPLTLFRSEVMEARLIHRYSDNNAGMPKIVVDVKTGVTITLDKYRNDQEIYVVNGRLVLPGMKPEDGQSYQDAIKTSTDRLLGVIDQAGM